MLPNKREVFNYTLGKEKFSKVVLAILKSLDDFLL